MTSASGAGAAAEPLPGVAERARAKVNLYLHVVGRRGDGYHLLDSLVVFPDIGDRIEVLPADRLTLAVDGPFAGDVPGGGDNLLLKAAAALRAATGIEAGAAIRLRKRLPVAAGIGGGSADAAAVLQALVRVWRLDLAPERLAAVALALGADVPMCLAGRPAFVGGMGEVLAPAPMLPPFALVLVNPRRALPTPGVFRARQGGFSPPARFSEPPPNAAALARLLESRGNDLTAAAISLCPQVAEVLAALADEPGVLLARMSGSGATCFGLVADAALAAAAAARLRQRRPDWWIAAAAVADAALPLSIIPP